MESDGAQGAAALPEPRLCGELGPSGAAVPPWVFSDPPTSPATGAVARGTAALPPLLCRPSAPPARRKQRQPLLTFKHVWQPH